MFVIEMFVTWSLHDKDHMSELRIKNRSESEIEVKEAS